MAKTVTNTRVTHYEVQKKRRQALLEQWRGNRRSVISPEDVAMVDSPSRRMRRGVYAGLDGDRPTRVLDATLHEVPPATVSTVHRHSWDAIMFVAEGRGWTEIDGQRIDWRPWDTLHLPGWAWHRHGNDSDRPARFHTWSVQPMFESFGMALLEEGGDAPFEELPARPRQAADPGGDDPYARRLRRLAATGREGEGARLITRWDDVQGLVTKRGARSAFLMDVSIGYHTSGLSAVIHELAPGLWQSRHRHGGEAWLYVVSGTGHSEIDGVDHRWKAGDLIVIDHWQWHQHFNDDQRQTARLIRIHNFDALYDTMRILLDPLNLFEEPPQLDAPDVSDVRWPDMSDGRPHWH
jgi:gentisate 1,2-dioxygenase